VKYNKNDPQVGIHTKAARSFALVRKKAGLQWPWFCCKCLRNFHFFQFAKMTKKNKKRPLQNVSTHVLNIKHFECLFCTRRGYRHQNSITYASGGFVTIGATRWISFVSIHELENQCDDHTHTCVSFDFALTNRTSFGFQVVALLSLLFNPIDMYAVW
jgi:hypothetical protein